MFLTIINYSKWKNHLVIAEERLAGYDVNEIQTKDLDEVATRRKTLLAWYTDDVDDAQGASFGDAPRVLDSPTGFDTLSASTTLLSLDSPRGKEEEPAEGVIVSSVVEEKPADAEKRETRAGSKDAGKRDVEKSETAQSLPARGGSRPSTSPGFGSGSGPNPGPGQIPSPTASTTPRSSLAASRANSSRPKPKRTGTRFEPAPIVIPQASETESEGVGSGLGFSSGNRYGNGRGPGQRMRGISREAQPGTRYSTTMTDLPMHDSPTGTVSPPPSPEPSYLSLPLHHGIKCNGCQVRLFLFLPFVHCGHSGEGEKLVVLTITLLRLLDSGDKRYKMEVSVREGIRFVRQMPWEGS